MANNDFGPNLIIAFIVFAALVLMTIKNKRPEPEIRGRTLIKKKGLEDAVLFISKNPELHDYYGKALNEVGYRTLYAADSTEGLRVFKENFPEMVIVDLGHPDKVSDRNVAVALQEMTAIHPRLPVIKFEKENHRKNFVAEVSVAFLVNPSTEDLLAIVNCYLKDAWCPSKRITGCRCQFR